MGDFDLGNVPTSDPSEILEFHCKLIAKMLENESVVNSLSGERGDVGIILADPAMKMKLTLDGVDTRLESLDDGDLTSVDPTLRMRWETALNFWLGKIDPVSAFFSGKIKLEGRNMDPLFKLKEVVDEAKEASREVAAEFGW